MEILSYNCAPCSHVVKLRLDLALKSSNLHQSRLTFRKHKFWCTKIDSRYGTLRFHNLDQSIIKKPSHQSRFRSLNILKGFKNVDSKVLSGGYTVYIVGNSLGGFVALYFAAHNPHLVKGVTLLNATPLWGFLANPIRSPRLAKLFPWARTFPLPSSVRKLTEFIWQKISDPRRIAKELKQVYADHSTNVDKVFSCILETTQYPAAATSFASIMFAPQGQLSFRNALSRCQMNNVPICFMYGKEDPGVKPVWGVQVKRQVPEAPYYEISSAGHYPHDEVPEEYLTNGGLHLVLGSSNQLALRVERLALCGLLSVEEVP